jgi:hypothetical protein
MKWPGEIPAIFVWTPLLHESSQRNAGTTWRRASPYSLSFFLRWPSVRSRKALSLMKPAASR